MRTTWEGVKGKVKRKVLRDVMFLAFKVRALWCSVLLTFLAFSIF